MTDVKQISGGAAVPIETLVQCDQLTILGDGSHGAPLHAVGGGAIAVVADGTTILGDGTTGDPLRAPGDGNISVVADGTTILGDGTTGDPLRAASGGATFTAAFAGLPPIPGRPVQISASSEPGGITTVRRSTAGNFLDTSTVDGVIAVVNQGDTVEVQTSGVLTLTTGEWDAVTGDSGGLVLGSIYYLQVFPGIGLTRTPTSDPGVFLTKVGVALSSTTLLVAPSFPTKNLGDQTFLATFNGQPPLIGTIVFVSDDGEVSLASNDVSDAEAQTVGIIVGFDVANGTDPIVQVGGVVTLTVDQWNAVGGMTAGTPFYVSTAPGLLTFTRPVTGRLVQVGVGLSPTQMIWNPPLLLTLP